MEALKGKKSSVSAMLVGEAMGPIKNIVFACDAGMGSSAMGASVLRKKIQAAGFEVKVVNQAISNLTDSYDIVVSHQDLIERAKLKTPSAVHVSVDNFMASPKYDDVVEMVRAANAAPKTEASPVMTAPVAAAGAAAAVAVAEAPVVTAAAAAPVAAAAEPRRTRTPS